MHFNIDPTIFVQYPDLKIGVIIIRHMDNSKRVSAVESLLRGIAAQRQRQFLGKDITQEPMVKVWNEVYGRFGVNPNKYSPSISAMLQILQDGKAIEHINTLVDLHNYFSLKFLLPVGGVDLDWLCGDLKLAFTKGGEAFRPLGSVDVEKASEGEIAFMDSGGITCRYWNHRECERTKFTTRTTNAALFVEDISKMHMDEFGEFLREIQNGLIKYIGGQIEPYILNEDAPSLDFGIEGRKTADDSKVPRQEVVHFLKTPKEEI